MIGIYSYESKTYIHTVFGLSRNPCPFDTCPADVDLGKQLRGAGSTPAGAN